MTRLTYAFCTYNRAERLDRLVAAMRAQTCPVPFEILAVNNNSSDHTAQELSRLTTLPGAPLRWVTEPVQGIVAARNRCIAEALDSDILVFIDDDELPEPGLLAAAADAICNEGANCAGGRVVVDFAGLARPRWLEDDVLGFLAAVDHGPQPFWVDSEETPVWTANVAYDMAWFRARPELRFDKRYDRVGKGAGGGEDFMMFRALLNSGARIRYRPDMVVLHSVEPWRLRRGYFLTTHYRAGYRRGQYEMPEFARTIFGVPPFMVVQLLRQAARASYMYALGKPGALRQAMNVSFAWGVLRGHRRRPHAADTDQVHDSAGRQTPTGRH